ncbi:hypothetical protein DER46DRAFT_591996 [Fusarium sp. MPI-SDFR-AT-0072]|nr:hypothetical protein DER46DRAFT_591996 [Fusarium sp. MPI-SDFR-AT-0072]
MTPKLSHSWDPVARLLWFTAFLDILALDLLNFNHPDIISFLILNPSKTHCCATKQAGVRTHIIGIWLNAMGLLFSTPCTPL